MPVFDNDDHEPDRTLTPKGIRDALENAVVKRMMSDVNYGLFLSGGDDVLCRNYYAAGIPHGPHILYAYVTTRLELDTNNIICGYDVKNAHNADDQVILITK